MTNPNVHQVNGLTNTNVHQINGISNLTIPQNYGTSLPPPYQDPIQPAVMTMNSNIPRPNQMFENYQGVYPALSQMDTLTARTTTNNNGSITTDVAHPQGSYPAATQHQTAQRRIIHPSSMTSLGSHMSNHTNRTVRHSREKDLPAFTYFQKFEQVC